MTNKIIRTLTQCFLFLAISIALISCGTNLQTKIETEPTNLELQKADRLAKQGQLQKAAEI